MCHSQPLRTVSSARRSSPCSRRARRSSTHHEDQVASRPIPTVVRSLTLCSFFWAVVDEGALVEALQSGQLASAALDVFTPPECSANIHPWLMASDKVILTPHSACNTHDLLGHLEEEQLDNRACLARSLASSFSVARVPCLSPRAHPVWTSGTVRTWKRDGKPVSAVNGGWADELSSQGGEASSTPA